MTSKEELARREGMERLTTNKNTSEMGMYELAMNNCYSKDGLARYRDFEKDVDARVLTRKLLKKYAEGDDAFDEEMIDLLQYGTDTIEGLIALFYLNLWTKAELRERLKAYEDAEEQGLLLRLPCKVGDTVYQVNSLRKCVSSFRIKAITTTDFGFWIEWQILDGIYINLNGFNGEEIGKTVFLTREEAEARLKELEGK